MVRYRMNRYEGTTAVSGRDLGLSRASEIASRSPVRDQSCERRGFASGAMRCAGRRRPANAIECDRVLDSGGAARTGAGAGQHLFHFSSASFLHRHLFIFHSQPVPSFLPLLSSICPTSRLLPIMSSSGLAWRKKSCHTLQVEHDQDELPEAVLKLRGTTLPLHNRPSGRALAYWLAAILTLWWLSPKRIESQLSPSSSSSSATTTLPRGGDRIVWGLQDETIQRIDLPAPQDDKYISTLQAAVVSQEETYRHRRGVPADYFLQVLSIIGGERPARQFLIGPRTC